MKCILVVDDSADFSRMLKRTLEQHSMEAIAVDTTDMARTVLAAKPVDAVMIDIVLGTENGWETLRLLREISDVPILLMSGIDVDDDVRIDAQKLGAQGVLKKPFETAELLNSLSLILKS
jgi:DNA-binding response OmpR family regulator